MSSRPLLAPPAERQQRFSSAELSVVNLSLKSCISQKWPDHFFGSASHKTAELSNAELSVFRLSVVNYSLKMLISRKRPANFFPFWYETSLCRYQCTVQIWIWLNHPKGHFKGRKVTIWPNFHFILIFSKTV